MMQGKTEIEENEKLMYVSVGTLINANCINANPNLVKLQVEK